jgi:hypothetical protein
MTTTNMNIIELNEPNVMADNAIIPPASTQPTAVNEAAITPRLQRWLAFVEQIKHETYPLYKDDEVAPFIKEAEERKNMRAEKRLNTKLRRMEVEQKAILLAEAKESMEKARRKFESQPQVPYDYTLGPPSSIEDFFREEKERHRLIALEREQKQEVLKNLREQTKRECGVEWPPVYEDNEGARYAHIPKHPQFYIDLIKGTFRGAPTVTEKEANENPAT